MTTETKRNNKICHHHITRVMYFALVAFTITTALVVSIYFQSAKTAEATIGQKAFGGPIVVNIPLPTPTLSGICPPHVVVMDYSLTVPIPKGIVVPSIFGVSAGATFDYGNLLTPGVYTLGEHSLLPVVTCGGFPYAVYIAFFNPTYFKFQIGTGLVPGF